MIALLEQKFSKLASRRFGLVLCLVGHAGIGKTHTAQLVLKALPIKSVSLHAIANSDQFFLRLPRVGRVAGHVQTTLQRLQRNEIKLTAAAEAVAAWLVSLAPFVLHLEDIHEASLEQQIFWNSVAKAIKTTRGVGILATSRGLPPSEFEALPLEVLSSDASQALLATKLGAALPKATLDWILPRASGNPLFLLEFLKLLMRQGSVWSDGKDWHWREPTALTMPSSLEALIENMLEPIVTDTVLSGVFGLRILIADSFELWQPASQLPNQPFEAARLTLQNHGVLDSQFSIAHPLFSEVFRHTQKQLLQLAARKLLPVAPPVMAAALLEFAKLEPLHAKALLEKAIAELEQNKEVPQALSLKVQLLEFINSPERPKMAFELALVLVNHDPKAALQLLDVAIEAPLLEVPVLLKKANWLAAFGLFEDGKRTLTLLPNHLTAEQNCQKIYQEILVWFAKKDSVGFQYLTQLWENHPEIHASASFNLYRTVAEAYANLGNTKRSWYWLEVAKALPSLSFMAQAVILNSMANLLKTERQYPKAVMAIKSGIALLEPQVKIAKADINELRQFATLQANLSSCYLWTKQYQEAVVAAQKSIKLTLEYNLGESMAAELNLAAALRWLGQFELAERYFLEYLQTVRVTQAVFAPMLYAHLMMLYSQRAAALDELLAIKYAREILRITAATSDIYKEAKLKLIELEARFGHLEIAKKYAQEIQLETGFTPWQQAFILERQNSRDAAVKALSEAQNAPQFTEEKDFIELELVRMTQDRTLALDLEQRLKTQELGGLLFVLYRFMPDLEQRQKAPLQTSFRIANLGSLQFERDGLPINYKAAKGRELLALLSELRLRGQGEISQLELLDLLYLNFEESAAIAALQQLIYRLRSHLGQNVIVRTSTGYALGDEVRTDAETFLQTADSTLWRGAWLADFAGGQDSMARNRIYQALTAYIENAIIKNPDEAARLALIWLEAEPYELDAVMLARDALLASGDALGAEQLYSQAQVRFHEVGVQLSPLETRAITSR